MDLTDETKVVLTPEQVAVTYRLAGIGTRFSAALIDSLLQVTLLVVLWAAFVLVLLAAFGSLGRIWDRASFWAVGIGVFMAFALEWGYAIYFETVWHGQTPGKRLCGLRVLRDGGFPIDFRAAMIRNVMRFVDFLPFAYGAGVISIFFSRDSKRLGDFGAGTIVVVDTAERRTPAPASQVPAQQDTVTYSLLSDEARLNLGALSRGDYDVIRRFLERKDVLDAGTSLRLAREIALPVMRLLGVEPPNTFIYRYDTFLEEVASAYRSQDQGRA
jgi:uncharacterized RDD family membrane protein YckC